jgi:hypothetical protein
MGISETYFQSINGDEDGDYRDKCEWCVEAC